MCKDNYNIKPPVIVSDFGIGQKDYNKKSKMYN